MMLQPSIATCTKASVNLGEVSDRLLMNACSLYGPSLFRSLFDFYLHGKCVPIIRGLTRKLVKKA